MVILGVLYWLRDCLVNENEQALLLRFVYTRTLYPPGLHFAWPYPIDEIVKIEVEEQRTIESNVGWITAEGDEPQDSFSFTLTTTDTLSPVMETQSTSRPQ